MDVVLEFASLVARGLVGLIFVLAGVSKARAPAAFQSSLAQYGILPARLRPLVSAALPPLEIVLGALLIAGAAMPAMAGAGAALLVLFTIASLVRPTKDSQDCGCFGSFGTLNVKNVAARNAVLIALVLLPLAAGSGSYSIEAAWGVMPALAVALAVSAVLLASIRLVQATSLTTARPTATVVDPSRRSFLGKLAMVGAGAMAATAISALRGTPRAEAACYGCGSCGYQYFFISCSSWCCAAFWEAPLEYCEPSCYTCGSWYTRVYCNYPPCCW